MKIIYYLAKQKTKQFLGLLLFFIILISLLFFSKQSISSIQNSLKIFINNIIPSLFPFILLSEFAQNSNVFAGLTKSTDKFLNRFFKLTKNSTTAIILGFFCGFPNGAKSVNTMYSNNMISQRDSKILLSFVNNFNPAFIISTLGILVYNNIAVGFFLMIISYISSFIVGIIYSRFNTAIIQQNAANVNLNEIYTKNMQTNAFDNLRISIKNTLISLSFILSFLIIFNLLWDILSILFVSMGINNNYLALFSGIFEITRGSIIIPEHIQSFIPQMCYQSFLLGFGSLSIIFQVFSAAQIPNISISYIFKSKLLHGIISSLISYILLTFTNLSNILQQFNNFSTSVNSNIDLYSAGNQFLHDQLFTSFMNTIFIVILLVSLYMIYKTYIDLIIEKKRK